MPKFIADLRMRDDIVACAQKWIGTRFAHQGRVCKTSQNNLGGCDCLGLLIGISRDLQLRTQEGKLIYKMDQRDYGIMTRNDTKLYDALSAIFKQTTSANKGDIVLLSMYKWPSHLAILSHSASPMRMVHACSTAGMVIERVCDKKWLQKIYAVFDILSGLLDNHSI